MKVIAKIGNTTHPRYGLLVKGQEYEIDESEFGDEIFALAPLSPLPSEGEGRVRGGSEATRKETRPGKVGESAIKPQEA